MVFLLFSNYENGCDNDIDKKITIRGAAIATTVLT